MEVYTDSHHSEITQVMYNKLDSKNKSWDYILYSKGFLDELVFRGQELINWVLNVTWGWT